MCSWWRCRRGEQVKAVGCGLADFVEVVAAIKENDAEVILGEEAADRAEGDAATVAAAVSSVVAAVAVAVAAAAAAVVVVTGAKVEAASASRALVTNASENVVSLSTSAAVATAIVRAK